MYMARSLPTDFGCQVVVMGEEPVEGEQCDDARWLPGLVSESAILGHYGLFERRRFRIPWEAHESS